MILIPLSSLAVPPRRFRREFDPAALNDLREDILKNGLLQPIVVRPEGTGYALVAGERRLRAITDAFELGYEIRCGITHVIPGSVPCINLGDLPLLAQREAEYAENAVRKDFTWQENVAALEALMELRREQAAAENRPAPTVGDLSLEVRGNADDGPRATTRKELIVARYLDDPDVAAAKTAADAYKVVMKKERAGENLALAESLGPMHSTSAHTVLNEDSIEWMQSAEPNQFDVILTDPPYGVGADEFGDSGGLTDGAHGYKDTVDLGTTCMRAVLELGFTLTKPQAHIYMFLDIDFFSWARDVASKAGWKVHRTPLIFHKPGGSRMPWPHHGPQRRYEVILYAIKGDMQVQRIAGDVLTYTPDENLGHAAQKPVALFMDLLSRSVRPGMRILDPFGGTGPLIPAAHEMKCFSTVIEKDPTSYGIAAGRVNSIFPDMVG